MAETKENEQTAENLNGIVPPVGETPEEETATAQAAEATKDDPKASDAQKADTQEPADETAQSDETPKEEPKTDPLEEAQKKIAELEDKYLRCRAEFDNYRKRMAREFTETRDQARRTTITDFLTVYDYFAMGMSAIDTAPNVDILKQGMVMIWNEFQKVLEGLGVKVVDSLGKPFDAKFHEAVSQEASETVPEGTIVREWKKAFMIGDKLLRPAVVVVSSGPAKPAEPEKTDDAEAKADDTPVDVTEESQDTTKEQ